MHPVKDHHILVCKQTVEVRSHSDGNKPPSRPEYPILSNDVDEDVQVLIETDDELGSEGEWSGKSEW